MTIEISDLAWADGRIVPRESAAPSLASISLHTGVAVFDGVRGYWNDDHHLLFRGLEHFQRMCTSSANMGLACPWSPSDLVEAASSLLAYSPGETRYVRPITFRPDPEIRLHPGGGANVSVCMFTVGVDRDCEAAVSCAISSVERLSSRAIPVAWKTCGGYVNSYLAQMEVQERGFDIAILCDQDGNIAEASTANIFFVCGDRLVTPRLQGDIFPGLTRATVLDIAADQGIVCDEREVRREELPSFDAAFLCATLMEIRRVSRIDEEHYESADDATVSRIVEAFRRLTRERSS